MTSSEPRTTSTSTTSNVTTVTWTQPDGLTEEARRDLAAMRRGELVDLQYGQYRQLVDAGLIEGTQDDPHLTERAS